MSLGGSSERNVNKQSVRHDEDESTVGVIHTPDPRLNVSDSGVDSLHEMGDSGCVATLFRWLDRVRRSTTTHEPLYLSDSTATDTRSPQRTVRPSSVLKSGASRRTILQATGSLLATSAVGATAGSAQDSDTVDRDEHVILGGTQYETNVYTVSSPNEGRTVLIFGGVHGNELGGIDAAHLATEYTINRGTLVVIPEANKAAVDRGNNHGPEGDLNRQFPVGAAPTTEVAQGLWNELLTVDPDMILDMHTSTTLFRQGSIGQALFPTSGVVEHAENTANYLNETYMNERAERDLPDHPFSVGGPISKDRPLLIHKAAADQNIAGWLTEVTRIDLNLEQKTFLHDMMTRELLRQSGIDVTSAPEIENVI